MKALTLTKFIIHMTYILREEYIYWLTGSIKLPSFSESLWDDLTRAEIRAAYIDFYTQSISRKFTVNTITELFEGWEYKSKRSYTVNDELYELYHFEDKNSRILITRLRNGACKRITYLSNEYEQTIIFPRTLNDFLNICEMTGIELEFKEGALQ